MPIRTPRRRNDDERNALALANDGLVWQFARRYADHGVDDDDMIQEGRIAVLAAARDYDPARAKFSTHGVRRIIAYCHNAARKSRSLIHVPLHRLSQGVPHPVIEHIHGDQVAAPDDSERQDEIEAAAARVEAILSRLDPEDAELLRRRWGLGGCERVTQVAIARERGVSKQAISARESAVLSKLREFTAG